MDRTVNPPQSGNFDFPPASPSPNSSAPSNFRPSRYLPLSPTLNATFDSISASISSLATQANPNVNFDSISASISSLATQAARLGHLRDLLRSEREEDSAGQLHHQGTVHNIPALHPPAGWPPQSGGTTQRLNPTATATEHRLRRRTTPSERYLQRPVPATRQRSSAEHLAQSRLALEAIRSRANDIPPTDPLSGDIAALEYEGEAEVNRRNKRRKLDVDSCGAGLSGFSYGRYGQVEPGELNMQIVCCDGGNFTEGDGESRHSWAENVLRKDASVYYTKSNRCNLVLRHKGGTAFTLTGLDIKSPRRGFSAPVREGMVFVSMTCGDLLSRTARYLIRYSLSPSNILPSSSGRVNDRQGRHSVAPPFRTLDAIQTETHRLIDELNRRSDLNYLMPPTLSPRGDEQMGPTSRRARAPLNNTDGNGDDRSLLDARENCDFSFNITNDSEQNQTVIVTLNPPPFTVTTEYTDEEDEASPYYTSDWEGRGAMGTVGLNSEEDEDQSFGGRISTRRSIGGRWEEQLRLLGRSPLDFQPRITSNSAEDTLQAEPPHAVLGEEDEILAPHARFSIKRDKSKCSIKFDPPVSGRFILLKLWSPSRDENIGIQSVVAHGFAGPRYFPATQMQ
ncbi:MAG: hypothetical protein M1839_001198 [Geoglossum umbratile]|nr:MAG: hypothetical protein M1839_001198 [Geoglossum umbratile]